MLMFKRLLASLSSIIAALLASSCCWLPFVLIGFGISGGAIVAKMSQFRPLFLVLAILALGYASFLYVRNRKKAACCEGKKKGFDWHLLSLISTALIVIAIALYPLYYPLLPISGEVIAEETNSCDTNSMILKLDSIEENTENKKSCCP